MAMFLNGESWKTGERVTEAGGRRGRLYPYHFVENGEADALKMARRDIMDKLQKTIQRRMGKMGIVMG